ncbi:MAG: BrnT family toxin [Nitrospirae bacterium]|nr:BrnT family toxin [Nitrospirota bacterium]
MQKHGVTFGEAATVMCDPRAMNMYDPDHSESEDRWMTLGLSSSGRLLVVCHTFNEKPGAAVTIRIYFARRPTPMEIKNYEGV